MIQSRRKLAPAGALLLLELMRYRHTEIPFANVQVLF